MRRLVTKEPPHQDLHFYIIMLLTFDLNSYLQLRMWPNSEIEKSISGTQG